MFKNQSIQAEHFRSLILKPITTTRNGSNRTQQCRIPVTEKLAATSKALSSSKKPTKGTKPKTQYLNHGTNYMYDDSLVVEKGK